MKFAIVLLVATFLVGCATSGYKQFYKPYVDAKTRYNQKLWIYDLGKAAYPWCFTEICLTPFSNEERTRHGQGYDKRHDIGNGFS